MLGFWFVLSLPGTRDRRERPGWSGNWFGEVIPHPHGVEASCRSRIKLVQAAVCHKRVGPGLAPSRRPCDVKKEAFRNTVSARSLRRRH